MTTDLEVARQSVLVTVADLDAVADGIGFADTFVHTYFTVEPGGRFLTQSSSLLASIRDSLGHQYAEISTKIDGAAGAVQGIWNTYERTDAQVRLEFERAQRRAEQGGGGLPSLTVPPTPISPHPQPPPATRSVDAAALRATLGNPQADTRGLDALDTWRDIKDRIDQVLSFEWLTGPMQHVGLHVPLDRFRAWMEGNYGDMADAAAGLFALGTCFHQVDAGTKLTAAEVGHHWLGRSSEAVQTWLGQLSGAAWLHGNDLTGYGSTIQVQAETAKLVLDQLLDLLGDLADCMPVIEMYGEALVERAVALTVGQLELVLRVLSVAARLVVKIVVRLELLYDAVMLIITFLTSCSRQLRFPQVTTPQAPR